MQGWRDIYLKVEMWLYGDPVIYLWQNNWCKILSMDYDYIS